MEGESVYKLALRCAEREIASADFLNLYKEFYNEKVSANVENDDSPEEKSKITEVCNRLATDLLQLLNSQRQLLLADYVAEVLFVNYNSELVNAVLPQIYSVDNPTMLLHFFSQSCAFFAKLSDSLIADDISKDAPKCIIPSVLNADPQRMDDTLIVAVCKFLQFVLKNVSGSITIESDSLRESCYALMSRLSKLNKLLHRKVSQTIDSKIEFKNAKNNLTKDSVQEYGSSPSISSPQFIASPFSTSKVPSSKASTVKYQDMKLLRFYKNIWLNNKIKNWEPIDAGFLSRYASIAPSIFQDATIPFPTVDAQLTDLIETSFTCFAQFVSNKQYHQSNSNLNLLERQWIIFIVTQIPLLILENSTGNSQVITNALGSLDDKVVKAIRTYYSEKDDAKNRNEDLFDDYPSASLDIRHEFIKSLVKLGLQPATAINEYLREDQVIDTKSLPVTDDLTVNNSQGGEEVITDIKQFVSSSLDSLEPELVGIQSNEHIDGLQQVLRNFENVPPTKQKVLSHVFVELLEEATNKFDFNRIGKICLLLSFNFSHSLTAILTFMTPVRICEILMKFIDVLWDGCVEVKRKELADSEFETMNMFSSFTWSLLMLIVISQNYDISLIDVALQSSELTTESSFTIPFVSKLPEIPDIYFKDQTKAVDPNMHTESHQMVENWLRDLFVNGSISDSLLQSVDAKQLASLIPFIFKQILLALEVEAIDDISNLVGGFEYFLQPFMLIGLIKIVYWLEQYLYSLRSDMINESLLEKVFTLLNTIFNPTSLNEDSRSFHSAVLRLNAVRLLRVLRKFRVQSQSNYGIYSSEASGHPKLESLIKSFTTVLQVSTNYNLDPRDINSENAFSQKQLGYGSMLILNENPINKIMTNQINSFWNLHSSTYYNLDYLEEIIDLVTPRNFLIDVFRTLEYKLSTYGVPGVRNKMSPAESEHVLNYLFYFLALYDVKSQDDATKLLSLMEKSEIPSTAKEAQLKSEPAPKQEARPDDDFDMLFGENDTSTHGGDEEVQVTNVERNCKFNGTAAYHRGSFGLLLHELKVDYDSALAARDITKEARDKLDRYHEKYIHMLRTCVF